MKKSILLVLFPILISFAQTTNSENDTTTAKQPQAIERTEASKWYYGGTLGFNFWSDYFYLSLNPIVGYQITPKFSIGGKLLYAYINDKSYDGLELKSNNYGASIFARYRPIYQIYLHSEFAYGSFEHHTVYYNPISRIYSSESERNWVPFLLLGGGYVQRISRNASAYIEVLFDVINDSNSPYKSGDPMVSIGAGIGF
jgi:hypothetical protein